MANSCRRFGTCSAVFLLTLYPSFILPMATYFTEPSAYPVGAVGAILFFLVVAGFFVLALALVCSSVEERQERGLFCALLYICIIVYYNYNFHNYDGNIFGADKDVVSNTSSYIDYIVYSLTLVLIIVFYQRIVAARDAIAVFFFISNLVILLTVIFGMFEKKKGQSVKTPGQIVSLNQIYQLSPNRNIIHILFDGFQGSLFQKIMNDDPSIKEKLGGFIFYPDATSSSEVSYLSVPSVFSGIPYNGMEFISEYEFRAGVSDPTMRADVKPPLLIKHLAANGYRIDVLAGPGGGLRHNPGAYDSYVLTDFAGDPGNINGLARIVDVTLTKALPWEIKPYIYQDGDWFFTQLFNNEAPRANRAIEFLKIYGERLEPTKQQPVYKFVHLLTPHGPWTTDSNCGRADADGSSDAAYQQSKCTILALVDLLDSLKKKGIYDNTALLVHADHGMANNLGFRIPRGSTNFPKRIGRANPLVLLKPFASGGPLRRSEKQVQLIDIPATLFDLLEFDGGLSSESMLLNENDYPIERAYYQFEPNRIAARKLDRFTKVNRYVISGPIASPSSWRLESSVNADVLLKKLDGFTTGTVVKILKSGMTRGDVMWVAWEGPPPPKGTYAYVDGEVVPISIGAKRKFLSFQLERKGPSILAIYLVDPGAKIRQRLFSPSQAK